MAKLVYIDETGSSWRAAETQPHLTVAAAIVDETMVQPLREGLHGVAWKHLGWLPADLEFHGQEIWNGTGYWTRNSHDQRIAVYEDAMQLLDTFDIEMPMPPSTGPVCTTGTTVPPTTTPTASPCSSSSKRWIHTARR